MEVRSGLGGGDSVGGVNGNGEPSTTCPLPPYPFSSSAEVGGRLIIVGQASS